MKIGVYVGSFDPFHKGHRQVIDYLLNYNIVDKVMIIPTNSYWDKTNLTDIKQRLEMLRLIANNNIIIDDKWNDLPYTYLILRELKKQGYELYLIIGADNLLQFKLWRNYEEILENKIVIVPRNDINIDKHLEEYEHKEQFIVLRGYAEQNISSTEIRQLLGHKQYHEAGEMLDQKILEYIKKNNLYHK